MAGNDRQSTVPVEPTTGQYVSRIVVPAYWQDPSTKALYVHQDLVRTQDPWAEEAHIGPMATTERFGDVGSFVDYVKAYGGKETTFLTWNSQGLRAVLDYADWLKEEPGRCKWLAVYPFTRSAQWLTWSALASGKPISQKDAVEKLEDLAADITDPNPADLTQLLRSLRSTVNAQAEAELRPDGTTTLSFSKDARVQTHGHLDLPASFQIAIPVLKGHLDAEGRPVLYKLQVRLRVSVDDAARLGLRFTIPNAERVLEDVYADRVKAAEELLGDSFQLLRAAD